MTGFESGDKTLAFNLKEGIITAFINCRGGGKFRIDTPAPTKATSSPCDGIPTF